MVMDYEIRFGYNRNDNMVPVYGCEFDESGIERAIEVFQHHADNRKMSGEDFSDCDYVALYKRVQGGDEIMLKIRMF